MAQATTSHTKLSRWRRAATAALALALVWGLAFAQPYNEAPMLADLVAAGELPPVEERLPDEPLVVEPDEATGEYGGVLRRAFIGPADANNVIRVIYDSLVRFDPPGGEVIPHLVASWDHSEDFHEWSLYLRPGGKWSDGHPFDADALMFWYESVLLNEDLTPSIPTWAANRDGSPMLMERIDDYTVRYTFDFPNTLFLTDITFRDGADRNLAAFLPGHYLGRYHPEHASEADLQRELSAAGLTDWTQLFMARATQTENPNRPSTAAWVAHDSTVSDAVFTMRRNPYFMAVDTAGNQLPYIDEVQFRFFADVEALNFAAVAGEFDMQARHIQMTNYPVLIENAERSGYRVMTWPTFGGSDATVFINQTYTGDAELGELLATRDFRVALSLGIDRDEIRESAFLGLGEVRQAVPAPWHPYYPGDEVAYAYTQFDPETAQAMLDELGLERGADGRRTLPSGRPLRLEISVVPAFGPWPDVAQLVAADWERLGLTTDVQLRERTAHFTMRDANEHIMEIWNEDTTAFPFTGAPKVDPRTEPSVIYAVEYRTWYRTGGERGLEPSEDLARLIEMIEEAKEVGVDEQIALAREIYTLVTEEMYRIGTVGLTPMIQGVVVVNQDLKNVPEVVANDWPLRTPGNARPEQWFFDRP